MMSDKSLRNTILVAGSANLDFVVRAAHVPAPGETVLGRELATFPGGKGANQAVACARAGAAKTRMLLALGNDAYAEPLEASLREAGVALHIVRCENQATGTAFVCLSDTAQNAITVAPGANDALRAEHLPALDEVSHLLLQLETPIATVAAFAAAARAAATKVVLNAAPARELPPQLLENLDVLIVNEGELAAITGIHGNLARALDSLSIACAIVTLGERGACARHDGRVYLQEAFPVTAIDTTGAGDTFCGAFTAALCAGMDVPGALARASAAGALACTRLGAQSSVPSAAQVDAFLAAQPTGTARAQARRELAEYCGIQADPPVA